MSLKSLLENPVEQTLTVSHHNDADFKSDGLRNYARYRDLGFTEATGGMVQAQVIRLLEPCTDEVRQKHHHDVDLQMVYVLKGMMKVDVEGKGVTTLRAGSAMLLPAKNRHTVVDYGEDCEVLEINMPADFATIKA